MNKITPFLIFIALLFFNLGAVISDYGEVRPEFTVGYFHIIGMTVALTVPFFLGYITRKEEENA